MSEFSLRELMPVARLTTATTFAASLWGKCTEHSPSSARHASSLTSCECTIPQKRATLSSANCEDESFGMSTLLTCKQSLRMADGRTEAAAGNMIHLNDFEGLPALPLAVDDELITPQGAFTQPQGSSSYMAGFNGCVQLFPLLADCIVRTRRLQLRRRNAIPLSAEEEEQELTWESGVRDQLNSMMANLPPELGPNPPEPNEQNPDRDAILGMQRANILVTEASLRIALFDYVAELSPSSDLGMERSDLAHKAYETLSGIPLDDLAANGESIVSFTRTRLALI